MKMSAEQLQEKWDEVIQLITDTFEGERRDNILKMYEYFKDRSNDEVKLPKDITEDYFENYKYQKD